MKIKQTRAFENPTLETNNRSQTTIIYDIKKYTQYADLRRTSNIQI